MMTLPRLGAIMLMIALGHLTVANGAQIAAVETGRDVELLGVDTIAPGDYETFVGVLAELASTKAGLVSIGAELALTTAALGVLTGQMMEFVDSNAHDTYAELSEAGFAGLRESKRAYRYSELTLNDARPSVLPVEVLYDNYDIIVADDGVDVPTEPASVVSPILLCATAVVIRIRLVLFDMYSSYFSGV